MVFPDKVAWASTRCRLVAGAEVEEAEAVEVAVEVRVGEEWAGSRQDPADLVYVPVVDTPRLTDWGHLVSNRPVRSVELP